MSKQMIWGWLVSSLGVLVLCFALNLHGAAQGTDESVLVATPTEAGIQIYSVDVFGQESLIRTLTEFRVGDPNDQDLWFIDEPSNMTVSLDGTQIAFTAQRAGEWALFVYTLATDALQEITLPEALIPTWSPDSSAILLTVGSDEPPYNDYVYDLVEQQLIQLTNTPQYGERSFRWLPNSSGLLYVGLYRECETCESMGQALYYVSRDGGETRLLSHAAALGLQDSYTSVCWPTWSEPNQRIYYIVGCVGGGDSVNEYLYSVDLAGNNRAEISTGLWSRYPEEDGVKTVNIQPSPFTTDVYLTVNSQGGYGTFYPNRRILHLQAPDQISTVYEQTNQDEGLSSSSMSPDGTSIALVSYGRGSGIGFLEVIDLATGERVIGRDSTPLEVCGASWIDATMLFYTVDPTGQCELYFALQSVWVLDITSGETQEVTTLLGNNVWMLRQVVVTSPVFSRSM